MLLIGILVIGALGLAALGWNLKPAPQAPRQDVGLLIRLGLGPGEYPGTVWEARHADGDPMIATITSRRVLAFGFSERTSPPLRFAPGEGTVSVGKDPAGELVPVSLASDVLPELTVYVAPPGARAVASWLANSAKEKS